MKDVIITITATQATDDAGDMDTLAEFTTVGQFSFDGGSGTISYLESELTGMEGTFTTIHYTPDGARLERTGNLVSAMDFTPGAVSSELLTSRMSAPVAAAAAMFSGERPPARTTRRPSRFSSATSDQSASVPVPPRLLPTCPSSSVASA